MTTGNAPDGDGHGGVKRFDFIDIIVGRRRMIAIVTLAATALVAIVAGVYLLWLQPERRSAVLEFRPTFPSATEGEYPNGLAFGATDITAPHVLDLVFDRNNIQEFCSREAFRSGFFVEERSTDVALLEAQYQARLSEVRLTPVERERLLQEYAAKRSALPLQYRLVFLTPAACDSLTQDLMSKSVSDVLQTWADDSETRRGVLNLQVQILSPAVLDVGLTDVDSQLIRADLIRTALLRLIDNIEKVEAIPGAGLIRTTGQSLAEVRLKLLDLVQARLEPLVISAGRTLGRGSLLWAQEALSAAQRDQAIAEGRAKAYLEALREYSGTPQTPASTATGPTTSSSDVQSLTPQIDRTFIDRIIDMSQANTSFRQLMTTKMVEADVASLQTRSRVTHYENLIRALNGPGAAGMTAPEVDRRLDGIVSDGKGLAAQFNALYDEVSKVSLRAAASMYQIVQPLRMSVSRSFSLRAYLTLVAVTFALVLLLVLALSVVAHFLGPQIRVALNRAR